MSDHQVVRWEKQGHVATVWLSSPERRNAMGKDFFVQLPLVMAEVSADEEVRAVILAAEGSAFTVGLDLKDMQQLLTPSGGQAAMRQKLLADVDRLQRSISSVADCPVPVIAVLHGWCIGGGVDLCSACDIRVAAADLKLSIRETKVGIVADLGTLQRLPRIIGKGHMAELAFTGKDISAERAKQIGLVNDVYDTCEAALAAARQLATEIAENSPLVVKGVKRVLAECEDKSIEEGLRFVGVWNAAFLFSDDLMEAMMAFMQKRKPDFKGQ
jgi:enoyl-CoA hydratase